MPTASELLGGGTRYAVRPIPAPSDVKAEPVPILHAPVYCSFVAQLGFALRLASTPGASVIVTFPGAPFAPLSRIWVVV